MRDEVGLHYPRHRRHLDPRPRHRRRADLRQPDRLAAARSHLHRVRHRVAGMDVVDAVLEGDVIERVEAGQPLNDVVPPPDEPEPNALARAIARQAPQGASIIDLTESNPTRVGFVYPPDLLAPLADAARARLRSAAARPAGRRARAVAADFRRRGIVLSADRVALTASTSEAYALLFKLLCDAGDHGAGAAAELSAVRAPDRARIGDARCRTLLEYHGAWRIDLDSLRGAAGDRVRAILVVSPNNPDRLVPAPRRSRRDCRSSRPSDDLPLIGDEVFADYQLDPAPAATHVLAAGDVLTFSLGGLSKSAGLPQVKLGWIGFGGPAQQVDEALAAFEIVADTYLSVSTPVQVAAADADRTRRARSARQIQSRVQHNLETLAQPCRGASRRSACSRSRAAGRRCCRCRRCSRKKRSCSTLLEKDDVLVHPGYFFDFPREAFLVVSLLVEPARVRPGHRARAAHAPRRGAHERAAKRHHACRCSRWPPAASWGIGEFRDLADVRDVARPKRGSRSSRSCRSTRCRRPSARRTRR